MYIENVEINYVLVNNYENLWQNLCLKCVGGKYVCVGILGDCLPFICFSFNTLKKAFH